MLTSLAATMANIIFAERENAGLHAPTQKMRQRLQSAPEKLVKSPTKPFSTPLPSGRKAFGCLNVKVSTPAISKQEKKLLKQPPVCLEETKAKNAPQANVEYPETEKLFSYDPLEYLRYDVPEDLIPLSKLALPGLACFSQVPDMCEDDFEELAPLPNPPAVTLKHSGINFWSGAKNPISSTWFDSKNHCSG
ncbi:securin isoform X1 [Pundamilia nyererei]|uniref:Securin n=3 Tax=Pundamilia nyererei TaxID=303518 RepID=A0A9Y3V6F9_9CICH|nr:PREDICTED: securin isoform X1 [Pundamilia nyererei]